MTPDHNVWYQKRPDGPWYKIGARSSNPRYIKVCEYCGQEALMKRRVRFCSMSCGKSSKNPTYKTRHERVYRKRGNASECACVDCGNAAQDWSQIHGTNGLEAEHYEPRCRPCHSCYDIETQPRGERHGMSKLTDAQRRGIHASVGATQRELAEHFGVSQQTISDTRLRSP